MMARQKTVKLNEGDVVFLTGNGVAKFCNNVQKHGVPYAKFEIIWPKGIVTIPIGQVPIYYRRLNTFNPELYEKILRRLPIKPGVICDSRITNIMTEANPDGWARLMADLQVTIIKKGDSSGKLAMLQARLIDWLASAWSVSIDNVQAEKQAQVILAWLGSSPRTQSI